MPVDMSKEYQVRTRDYDRNRRLKLSSILDFFQEIAQVQASSVGMGSADMGAQGVFWAVVRQKFEILAQPVMGEPITARTWPYTSSRFAFQRDYQLRDPRGKLLVKATSEWVLMNKEKRSFEPLTGHYDETLKFCTERNFSKRVRKIHDFDTAALTPYRMVPGESTVDLNGHVNNACYADFVVDALTTLMPDLSGAQVHSCQFDYRYEVMAGEPLNIYALQDDPKTIRVLGKDAKDTITFAAQIELV